MNDREGRSSQFSELFFADGWRLAMTWILALIYPPQIYLLLHRSFSFESGFCSLNAAVNLLLFVTGIAFVPVWFCLVWGLAHRRRPVVAIGDEEVEFGSIFRFARRPVVPIAEIAALEGTPRKVRLRMRSGKGVPIGTPELSMDSRAAVRAALERRISGDPA